MSILSSGFFNTPLVRAMFSRALFVLRFLDVGRI